MEISSCIGQMKVADPSLLQFLSWNALLTHSSAINLCHTLKHVKVHMGAVFIWLSRMTRASHEEVNPTSPPWPWMLLVPSRNISAVPALFSHAAHTWCHELSFKMWVLIRRKLSLSVSSIQYSAGLLCGRSRVQIRPDQHSGSLNNWVESAAFVIISANG